MNIEKEIQAIVDFKMNELLTAVENTAKANWNTAFQNNSQKHSHYWEAFGQMKQMLIKEKQMSYENGTMEYEKNYTYDEAGTTDADKARRKERIATALMAGIYANSAYADIDCRMAAKCAIDGAEALVAELDRRE